MPFVLFCLSTFFLIEALIKKQTKLWGAPIVTKKIVQKRINSI